MARFLSNETLRSLSDVDLSIYNTIVRCGPEVARMQLKELAERAHVSQASVVRFCKKLGCSGFSEFKYRYRDVLDQQEQSALDDEDVTLARFLREARTSEFAEALSRASSILLQADRVLFVGIGSSGYLASLGARLFCGVGKPGMYVNDPYLALPSSREERSAVVAISFSGRTEETLRLTRQFIENGRKSLCISNSSDGPLARMCDVTIAYHVPEVPISEHFDLGTQVPVVYILERLARMLYGGRSPQVLSDE